MIETKGKILPYHGRILAIQLLEGSRLTTDDKRSVLCKINTTNDNTIYDEMKAAIRDMRSKIVTNDSAKDNNDVNATFYGENGRRSRQDWNRGKGYDRDRRSRSSHSRSRSRSRTPGNGQRHRSNSRTERSIDKRGNLRVWMTVERD